jgi:hypothetical protein
VNKNIRSVVIAVTILLALFLAYKLAFVRTVNYEIGGITIPSKYNILTGSVKPIKDYKGAAIKRTIDSSETKSANPKDIGMTREDIAGANVRWAIFEQWVKERPQYNGWDADKEIFQKAQDDFLAEMKSSGRRVTVIK